jgi:hypothetical protein
MKHFSPNRIFGGHGCFSSGHLIMSSTRHSLLSRGATTLLFSAFNIYLHPKQLTVFAKIYKNILTIIYTNIPINYPDASSLLSVLILLHNGLYTLLLLAAMTFAVPYYSNQGPPYARQGII